MTHDEIYKEYLQWANGLPIISREDLFRLSVANRDVYENEVMLINHLYYLIIRSTETKADAFAFYEANTFIKRGGDLEPVYSTCFVPLHRRSGA